ncbi:MAG: 3'-5' exonuclease [Pseudomonadota bacterium]
MRFAAIDFETANHDRASACAVDIAVVEGGRIVDRVHELIRPPMREFAFTHIHGLTWNNVRSAPTFADLWPELKRRIDSVAFLAAHNAAFDSTVLASCCRVYRLTEPRRRFVCTVRLSRELWGIHPTGLPDVCQRLRIPLRHHQADADAEACARIVIAAAKTGWTP